LGPGLPRMQTATGASPRPLELTQLKLLLCHISHLPTTTAVRYNITTTRTGVGSWLAAYKGFSRGAPATQWWE